MQLHTLECTPAEVGVLIAALQTFMGEMYDSGDPETNRVWKQEEKIAERLLKRLHTKEAP